MRTSMMLTRSMQPSGSRVSSPAPAAFAWWIRVKQLVAAAPTAELAANGRARHECSCRARLRPTCEQTHQRLATATGRSKPLSLLPSTPSGPPTKSFNCRPHRAQSVAARAAAPPPPAPRRAGAAGSGPPQSCVGTGRCLQ